MTHRHTHNRARSMISMEGLFEKHDDVMEWQHLPRNWPFVRDIHRSPVTSPHKGQWRGALMFSLICVWVNDWVSNRGAGDLRPHRSHYDVIEMSTKLLFTNTSSIEKKTVILCCETRCDLCARFCCAFCNGYIFHIFSSCEFMQFI